jgi:flavin reductase (DIM6/NTAB) family NADH-FMN oxidoreductase RutF
MIREKSTYQNSTSFSLRPSRIILNLAKESRTALNTTDANESSCSVAGFSVELAVWDYPELLSWSSRPLASNTQLKI